MVVVVDVGVAVVSVPFRRTVRTVLSMPIRNYFEYEILIKIDWPGLMHFNWWQGQYGTRGARDSHGLVEEQPGRGRRG